MAFAESRSKERSGRGSVRGKSQKTLFDENSGLSAENSEQSQIKMTFVLVYFSLNLQYSYLLSIPTRICYSYPLIDEYMASLSIFIPSSYLPCAFLSSHIHCNVGETISIRRIFQYMGQACKNPSLTSIYLPKTLPQFVIL